MVPSPSASIVQGHWDQGATDTQELSHALLNASSSRRVLLWTSGESILPVDSVACSRLAQSPRQDASRTSRPYLVLA